MIYLCNTFSLHMLQRMNCGQSTNVEMTRISAQDAGRLLRNNAFRSFFGHKDSAYHLGRYLHVTIPISRGMIKLRENDMLLVAAMNSKRAWEQGLKGCPGWRFYMVTITEGNDDDRA